MARGTPAHEAKVHYKGKNDDFIVIVESAQAVKDWKQDKSIPLAQVVNGWKVFVTHKHGAQGILDGASHAQLDDEFGTHKDEAVVEQILMNGEIQESKGPNKQGGRNDSNGAGISNHAGGVHN